MNLIRWITGFCLAWLLMLTLFISPALAADGNTLPDTGSVFSPASWTTDKLRLAIQAEDSSDVMSELAVKALVQREYEGKMLTTFMVNPDEVGRLVALLAKSFPDIQTAQSLDVPVELQNAIGKVFINAALPVDLLVQPAEKPESSDLLKIRPEPAAIRSVVESMGPQKAATYLKNIALVHGDGERFVHYVFEANQADIVYLAALLDKYYPGIWKVLRVDPKVLIDLQVPQVQSHQ